MYYIYSLQHDNGNGWDEIVEDNLTIENSKRCLQLNNVTTIGRSQGNVFDVRISSDYEEQSAFTLKQEVLQIFTFVTYSTGIWKYNMVLLWNTEKIVKTSTL